MGSIFCKSKRARAPRFEIPTDYNPNEIILKDKNDIAFSNIAKGSKVRNSTLPSGLVIPENRDGKEWTMEPGKVVLK